MVTAFKFIAYHQFGRGATSNYTSRIQFEDIKLIADDIRYKFPFLRIRSNQIRGYCTSSFKIIKWESSNVLIALT
jgi:hypothetical protein